jgi:exosortase/archaeosortase family protein
MPTAQPVQTRRVQELLLAAGLVGLTVLVFWPAARWLGSEAFAKEQLKQASLVLLFAGGWIVYEQRQALRPHFLLTNTSLGWLIGSYALAGAALLLRHPVLFLAGLVLAVGGLVHYVFGGQAFRRTRPLLLAFGLLIICVLLFPVLDWPLRQMAGVQSAQFLKWLGLAPQLLVAPETPVRLLLILNGQTFLVATECNGFGLITSSVLLGLIRMLYLRVRWPAFVVLLPIAAAVAFVFNFLRISAIVILAPRFPAHYHVLHETAGLIALYSGLGLVWWLTGWKRAR